MPERTPLEDPDKPLQPTTPAPEGSRPPQEEDPVTARNPDNPAY